MGKAAVLVWGSSYSAALVFVLAARHPKEIAAVLAFSPGEYIGGIGIAAAASRLVCPIFATSASDPAEEAVAAAILKASPTALKRQYKAKSGLHGSSTLRQTHAEDIWQAVERSLDEAVPR
jgi:pimeloyl-ACP methyl ester carboxylesterase